MTLRPGASGSRTIVFVRHGQSHANAGGATIGHAEVELTDEGHAQALQLAESAVLPATPSRVLSSPFARARQTAQPYANRTGRELELAPELREFDMVDPEMRPQDAFALIKHYWVIADPDLRLGMQTESFREFYDRVASFQTEVAPTLPDGTVCFGHGFWIAMLAWQRLGFTDIDSEAMGRFKKFQAGLPVPNTSAFGLVEAAPGSWFFRALPSQENDKTKASHRPNGATP